MKLAMSIYVSFYHSLAIIININITHNGYCLPLAFLVSLTNFSFDIKLKSISFFLNILRMPFDFNLKWRTFLFKLHPGAEMALGEKSYPL